MSIFEFVRELDVMFLRPTSLFYDLIRDASLRKLIALSAMKWRLIYWYEVTTGEAVYDGAAGTCALCKTRDECKECPIALATHAIHCDGTPYYRHRRSRYTDDGVDGAIDASRDMYKLIRGIWLDTWKHQA